MCFSEAEHVRSQEAAAQQRSDLFSGSPTIRGFLLSHHVQAFVFLPVFAPSCLFEPIPKCFSICLKINMSAL